MGKVRTRMLGFEDLEKQQIEEQKKKSAERKARKGDSETAEEAPVAKQVVEEKPVKVKVRGAKYRKAASQVDSEKTYSIADAVALLKKVKYAKFDESVELHMSVSKTGLKGEVSLPHSTGKTVRVRIADDATLDEIEKGKIEFDVLIAHPSFMGKLAKYARVLGPKGLMPNPKTGTVSPNPEEVVKKFEKGTMQWKTEAKFPLIHQMVAKISSEEKQIEENILAFLQSVGKTNIQSAFLKSSMSPSLQLELKELA